MRKVILLTAMPKESVWSSSVYVNGGGKVTFCVKHNLISTFFNFDQIKIVFFSVNGVSPFQYKQNPFNEIIGTIIKN